MMTYRVLTIGEDLTIAREVVEALERIGLSVDWIDDKHAGIARARSDCFDVVTLDLKLPASDGLSVLSAMRAASIEAPVLLLTEFCDLDNRIRSLRIGGDDYLVKPLELAELTVRIESLIRHRHGNFNQGTTKLSFGSLSVDRISQRVTRAGRDVTLSPVEYRIIEFMLIHAGLAIPRSMLFEAVWGYRFDPGSGPIDAHMRQLRKKIDPPATESIIRVQGHNYILTAPAELNG
jgi:two-component system OmpR family response regulator